MIDYQEVKILGDWEKIINTTENRLMFIRQLVHPDKLYIISLLIDQNDDFFVINDFGTNINIPISKIQFKTENEIKEFANGIIKNRGYMFYGIDEKTDALIDKILLLK